MTRVVVTGYASLDHVVELAGGPLAGTTTRMRRTAGGWPRPGGSPAYVATALAACGVADAVPVTWIGDDAAGAAYRDALGARGLRCDGIAVVAGGPTPVAILAYAPDGGCICLYDPGLPEPNELTTAQSALVAAADWVCITVGPPAVTGWLLDVLPPATRIAWTVKDDPHAFPRPLATRLVERADLICFSRAEAGFVGAALDAAGTRRRGRTLVETLGAAGARATTDGSSFVEPAPAVQVRDPTGAGDTLVGGLIAGLLADPTDIRGALHTGITAAADMLRTRQEATP